MAGNHPSTVVKTRYQVASASTVPSRSRESSPYTTSSFLFKAAKMDLSSIIFIHVHLLPADLESPRVHPRVRAPLGLPAAEPRHRGGRGGPPADRKCALTQLRDVDDDRRRFGATPARPAQFDPRRYVSYQVFENVNIHQRIPAEQIRGVVGSRAVYY